MFTTISVYTLLIAPPPLTGEQRAQLKKDKEVLHYLSLAFEDDEGRLTQACPKEDRVVADLAVRAAAMTQERARRSERLAENERPKFRIENRLNSATLSLDAANYWLKAAECRPSEMVYLDHAELALIEAERVNPGDVPLTTAIAERRTTIIRARQKAVKPRVEPMATAKPVEATKTEETRKPVETTKSTEPVDCPREDPSRAHLAARLAATMEERASQARNAQPDTDDQAKAASLFVEAAQLWLQAWKCQPSTVYLDNAEAAIVDAEKLGAETTVTRHLRYTIQSSRRKAFSERFSVRFDFGYGTGRLAPTLQSRAHTHRGGYLSISAMARMPPKTGIVNLLVGPYYTYWGANEHDDDPKVKNASVHEIGAKVEVSIGFKPRVAKIFTLNPGLEFGMQYVNFESWISPDSTFPDLVEQAYVNKAGATLGGSLGACFVYSSFCAMLRVHSVPDGEKSDLPPPAVMVGVGVDFFRVSRALLEWLDV